MDNNLTLCNNCVGKIILSLGEHVAKKGLVFCSEQCSEAYWAQDDDNQFPSGLAFDLGLDIGDL